MQHKALPHSAGPIHILLSDWSSAEPIDQSMHSLKEKSNRSKVNLLPQYLPNKIKTRGLSNEKLWSSAMWHSSGQKFVIEYLVEF
jgi:hypothetical protein